MTKAGLVYMYSYPTLYLIQLAKYSINVTGPWKTGQNHTCNLLYSISVFNDISVNAYVFLHNISNTLNHKFYIVLWIAINGVHMIPE